jgi:hypothetical protein
MFELRGLTNVRSTECAECREYSGTSRWCRAFGAALWLKEQRERLKSSYTTGHKFYQSFYGTLTTYYKKKQN